MHFIKRIESPDCQISLFSWNGKYIVKFEANQLEQTYKIDQTDVSSIEEVELVVNQEFVALVMNRFMNMSQDWYSHF
ncbi:MAG: hypothetical protein V4683_16535 [Bacteroidota bacterium]